MKDNKDILNPQVQATEIWSKVSSKLEKILGERPYGQWFEDLIPIGMADKSVYLQTKSRFESLWISNNYQGLIEELFDGEGHQMTPVFISPDQKIEVKAMNA